MREQTKTPPKSVHKDKTYIAKYQGVQRYVHPHHGHVWYSARFGQKYEAYYLTEIEAAKAVDKVRMSKGLKPVNVFKPKQAI